MSIDDITKLLDSITNLIAVLAWPVFGVFLIARFGTTLKELASSLSEFSFKGGGIETTLKRKQIEAAVSLAAATVANNENGAKASSTANEAMAAANFILKTVNADVLKQTEISRILWVDGKPENNLHERAALSALGINFILAHSTDEAVELLQQSKFDVIISDMNRPSDSKAGYTLLSQIRQMGNLTPYIIYAGSSNPAYKIDAIKRGALGSTNKADELFDYVVNALKPRK